MFALCREATIVFSTPLSSSCLTRAFFVGLLFSFFMISIIGISRRKLRNILCNFCGNAVDKFFQIFLDTRSDSCYNRPGTELFQARGGARKTLLLHLAFALAQMRTSFYHFTTLLGAQRAFAQKSGRGYPSKLIDEKK